MPQRSRVWRLDRAGPMVAAFAVWVRGTVDADPEKAGRAVGSGAARISARLAGAGHDGHSE